MDRSGANFYLNPINNIQFEVKVFETLLQYPEIQLVLNQSQTVLRINQNQFQIHRLVKREVKVVLVIIKLFLQEVFFFN